MNDTRKICKMSLILAVQTAILLILRPFGIDASYNMLLLAMFGAMATRVVGAECGFLYSVCTTMLSLAVWGIRDGMWVPFTMAAPFVGSIFSVMSRRGRFLMASVLMILLFGGIRMVSYGYGLFMAWGDIGVGAYANDVQRWSEIYSRMFNQLFTPAQAQPYCYVLLFGNNVLFPSIADFIFMPIIYDWCLVRILRRDPECLPKLFALHTKNRAKRVEIREKIRSRIANNYKTLL